MHIKISFIFFHLCLRATLEDATGWIWPAGHHLRRPGLAASGRGQKHSFPIYTAKLLFHQSPTRHSDYTVTTTVTMWSLFSSPRHRDYLTVTTSDTNVIRYPLPWGLCRNMSNWHLVSNSTVTTWEDTSYPLHTVTV